MHLQDRCPPFSALYSLIIFNQCSFVESFSTRNKKNKILARARFWRASRHDSSFYFSAGKSPLLFSCRPGDDKILTSPGREYFQIAFLVAI